MLRKGSFDRIHTTTLRYPAVTDTREAWPRTGSALRPQHGVNLGAEDTTAPYSAAWNASTASGSHTLTAVARDAAGKSTTAATVTVTAMNADVTAPAVSIAAPAAGSTVSGTAVTVSAAASDNVGAAGVQFKLDGVNLGVEDTTSPYGVIWNTTATANGSHTLTAVARDAAGTGPWRRFTPTDGVVNGTYTPPATAATEILVLAREEGGLELARVRVEVP